MHSVKRIYLRQWCFDASKPRVAASTGPQYHTWMGFSWRDKIPRCRVAVHMLYYGRKESSSGIRTMTGSGSKVNQFVRVPTPVDTQHFIQIHARVFIARQHTDARYWYSNSVRPSVCLSVRDVPLLDENGLTYCYSFFSPYASPIILVLSASNTFTKFRRGNSLRGR